MSGFRCGSRACRRLEASSAATWSEGIVEKRGRRRRGRRGISQFGRASPFSQPRARCKSGSRARERAADARIRRGGRSLAGERAGGARREKAGAFLSLRAKRRLSTSVDVGLNAPPPSFSLTLLLSLFSLSLSLFCLRLPSTIVFSEEREPFLPPVVLFSLCPPCSPHREEEPNSLASPSPRGMSWLSSRPPSAATGRLRCFPRRRPLLARTPSATCRTPPTRPLPGSCCRCSRS